MDNKLDDEYSYVHNRPFQLTWYHSELLLLQGQLSTILPHENIFHIKYFMSVLYPKVIKIFYEHFRTEDGAQYVEDLWNIFVYSYTIPGIRYDVMDTFLRKQGLFGMFFEIIWDHFNWLYRMRIRKSLGIFPDEIYRMISEHGDLFGVQE